MPPAEPLAAAVKDMSDEEVQKRAAEDSDAGETPPGFWDDAETVGPVHGVEVTVRLDPDVVSYFRGIGVDFRAGVTAVLRDYVEERRREG